MISSVHTNSIELHRNHTGRIAELWVALAICIIVLCTSIVEQIVHSRHAGDFAPVWLVFIAVAASGAAIIQFMRNKHTRLQQVLCWTGIFLMVWTANGLPLDLLRLTPLIPLSVDWHGLLIKTSAMAAAIVLAHIMLSLPAQTTRKPALWYGYAAFLLALPYPVMRTWWALGGTPGLLKPGAAGEGFIPWLACIPWLLAAVLSVLLVITPRRIPRKLLLAAGWFATSIVMLIGPGACWSLITKLLSGKDLGLEMSMATWVPCLFYGSWLLWAIAAGAATRSYQLR